MKKKQLKECVLSKYNKIERGRKYKSVKKKEEAISNILLACIGFLFELHLRFVKFQRVPVNTIKSMNTKGRNFLAKIVIVIKE